MVLNFTTSRIAGVIVVYLSGAILFGGESASLLILVKNLLNKSHQIVLDLGNVTHFDSGSVGTLVAVCASARKVGGDIKFVNLGNHIKEVLQITKFLTVFEIFDKTEDAIASKGPRQQANHPGHVTEARPLFFFIPIFAGNIILRHLMSTNLPLISVLGVFHAFHRLGLERVSFLEQLVHTLRIRAFDVGQSLQISSLLARPHSHLSGGNATVSTLWLFPRTCSLSAPAVFTSVFFGAAFVFAIFFLGVALLLTSFLLIAFFIGATFLPRLLFEFVFCSAFALVVIRANRTSGY